MGMFDVAHTARIRTYAPPGHGGYWVGRRIVDRSEYFKNLSCERYFFMDYESAYISNDLRIFFFFQVYVETVSKIYVFIDA